MNQIRVATPGAWSGSDIVSSNPTIIKNRIMAEGATNLSDPKNIYTIKAIQKVLGMAEDGQWTQTLMNRLQDYLMDSGDELNGSLKLTEKNLETLFGAGGILEQTNKQDNSESTTNTAKEYERVGEYISEEDYTKQSSAISRQIALNEKSTDVYAKMLQLYQGNTDLEAVRKYEQAQTGYNRNLELQSELQKMMDTLQSNRDYSAQAEEIERNGRQLYDTDIDAARAFAEETMPLVDQNNKEYAAIMTLEWVPVNRNGEIYMAPMYSYGEVMEGEMGNVVDIALAGLFVQTEGKKYLLHTHPDYVIPSKQNEESGRDFFSGSPYSLRDKGDASIPTLAGADWFELPNLLNAWLPLFYKDAVGNGLTIQGYDGIYLCSPEGNLYFYEGTGFGKYKTFSKKDFTDDKGNFSKAEGFPTTTGTWDIDTNTFIPHP